jgi:putative sterol carrier protein
VDGTCQELSEATPADCVISADPVTAHLVCTGRLSHWPAIASGRLTFSGERPEIGPAFFDLFVCP